MVEADYDCEKGIQIFAKTETDKTMTLDVGNDAAPEKKKLLKKKMKLVIMMIILITLIKAI